MVTAGPRSANTGRPAVVQGVDSIVPLRPGITFLVRRSQCCLVLRACWFDFYFSGGAEDASGDQSNTFGKVTSGDREGVQRIRRSLLHLSVGF